MKVLQVIPVSKACKVFKVRLEKTVSKVYKDQRFKALTVFRVQPVLVTKVFKVMMHKVFRACKVYKVLHFKVCRVQKERLVTKVFRACKA